MSSDLLTAALSGLPLGGLRYFDRVGSTNDEALAWARDGAPDFALVVADQQTKGRGRLGRSWVTLPGSALALSLVLRPQPGELDALAFFSPWGALAICQALEGEGLAPEIKWPNDILLERRKVAGILLETTWMGMELQSMVIGIGINVAPSAVPPADQVQYPAGSVSGVLGRPVDRWTLLARILQSMLDWRPHLGTPPFLTAWEERLAFRQEWVRVGDGLSASRLGQVLGVEPNGDLRLRDPQGQIFTLQAGEISLRLANDDPSQ